VLIVLALACGSDEPGRVLVIGIDGASPRLTEPWMEKGLLPNLAATAKRGLAGRLRSHRPLLSPRIWTSIATGKGPKKHGITGWVFKSEDGKPHMYRSHDRRGHALWNIASSAGLRVGVVNWLNTYPPEIVNGVMVSDFAIPGERQAKEGLGALMARAMAGNTPLDNSATGATTHPEEWAARLEASAARLEPVSDFAGAEHQKHLRPGALTVLATSYKSDRIATSTALAIDRELKPNLLMVYLSGIDRSSHFLWGGFEPPGVYAESVRFSTEEKLAAASAVRKFYVFTDGLIGELVAGFGDDDLVLIVSDHGFEARVKGDRGLTGTHDSKRAEQGVIFARGAGIAAGSRAGEISVNDITPTILAWFGLPVGEDMDGRPASFLKVEAPARIATHDVGTIERVGGSSATVEDTYIDELRALGYVDDEALPDKQASDD
jgi:predicted AlkP superfamily phosphohydrolase/phosphomutase